MYLANSLKCAFSSEAQDAVHDADKCMPTRLDKAYGRRTQEKKRSEQRYFRIFLKIPFYCVLISLALVLGAVRFGLAVYWAHSCRVVSSVSHPGGLAMFKSNHYTDLTNLSLLDPVKNIQATILRGRMINLETALKFQKDDDFLTLCCGKKGFVLIARGCTARILFHTAKVRSSIRHDTSDLASNSTLPSAGFRLASLPSASSSPFSNRSLSIHHGPGGVGKCLPRL